MSRKRILLLITNLGQGGAQRVFYDHAMAFSEQYWVEEVVFEYAPEEHIYKSGLPLHDLRSRCLLSRMGAIGRLLSRSLALNKLVADGRFDLVVSHMDGANWVNVLSFSCARKILVVHGTVLNDQRIAKFRQWLRLNLIFPLFYNWADHTVAVSASMARELTLHCGVKAVSIIQNFFDMQVIKDKATMPLDADFSMAFNHSNVLITSGRLSEQKKQIYLIDVFANILHQGINAKLVMLGDGELRERLIAECLDLKLRTYQKWDPDAVCHEDYDVYFLGYVENPYKYIARSSLFLFPSGWEGFPLALCEAMICGVPVLSADCPTGPREILAPENIRDCYNLREAEIASNGVLLPMIESENDVTVWANAVQKLLEDKMLCNKLANNGVGAMMSLDRSKMIRRWYELIEAICESN